MSSGSASLQPTYHGHVATTHDALALFEACLSGQLHHVPRRPHDRERSNLIRSGCVFIYEENASGIKRWTDGVPWSPSRILGNFLVYRELLKPFPPGEKKRATKRTKRTSKPGEPYPRPQLEDGSTYSPTSPTPPSGFKPGESFDRETERSLIGSLVDSYGFKEGGLVKKTMSVNVNGVHHHLVSYYKVEDVLNGVLEAPSQNSTLRYIKARHELTSRQNFRAPLDELEEGLDVNLEGQQRQAYGYNDRNNNFDRRPVLNSQGYPHHQQPPAAAPPPPSAGHHPYGYPAVEAPYLGGAHPHPSGPATYGVPAPASAPAQPYYPPNSIGHVQPKAENYGAYPPAGAYPPGFESLDNGMASVPAMAGDRGPNNQLQPMNYLQQQQQQPQPPIGRGRGGTVPESPSMIDNKAHPDNYNRGYYAGQPARSDQAAPSQFPATSEVQRWTSATTTARAENVPAYQQGAPEKAGYSWPVGTHVAPAHGHYPGPAANQRWSNPAV